MVLVIGQTEPRADGRRGSTAVGGNAGLSAWGRAGGRSVDDKVEGASAAAVDIEGEEHLGEHGSVSWGSAMRAIDKSIRQSVRGTGRTVLAVAVARAVAGALWTEAW